MQKLHRDALDGLARVEGKRGVGDGDIIGAGNGGQVRGGVVDRRGRLVPFCRWTERETVPAVSEKRKSAKRR